MGLIWEILAHFSDQSSSFFGARLFCKNTPKSVFNDTYNTMVFQDTYSQNGFFPHAFQSPDPAARPTRPPVRPSDPAARPTRPPVRPGRPSDPAARHGSQVIKLVRVPVFLSSKLNQNGSCSSISQFKTESKWCVFQYFSVHKLSKWSVFQYFQVPRFPTRLGTN